MITQPSWNPRMGEPVLKRQNPKKGEGLYKKPLGDHGLVIANHTVLFRFFSPSILNYTTTTTTTTIYYLGWSIHEPT